jgi:hypothetical protein
MPVVEWGLEDSGDRPGRDEAELLDERSEAASDPERRPPKRPRPSSSERRWEKDGGYVTEWVI